MAIKNLSEQEFVNTLQSKLSVRSPVKSIERLIGRTKEIDLINESLYDIGGHVFLYGDRGVGKSSLAATVATQYQSSDNEPIQIPCGRDTCFYSTIEEIAERVLRRSGAKRDYTIDHTINLKIYKIQIKQKDVEVSIPKIDSMFSAVDVMEEIARIHSNSPVIIIDEFDQIDCSIERGRFAHFLKDLGDRGVNIKFIFTGIASSLYQLLGDHESSFRQLFTLKVERLYWSYREEICYNAIEAFDLIIDKEIVHSIAKISNGFPYFVHLITQNLLWSVFKDSEKISTINQKHFEDAINRSIIGISGRLERPYNLAVLHQTHDHLLVLWATADSESVIRYTDSIFKSYLRINELLFGFEPLEEYRPIGKKQFKKILVKFKQKEFGEILELKEGREEMYSYRENLLRGYIALKAQSSGIALQGDVADEPKLPSARSGKVIRSNTGLFSQTPRDPARGVKFKSE